jgi:hypothetical protein
MAKRAPRRSNLSGISVEDLNRELRRRQSSAGRLVRKRDKLAARLAAMDEEIAGLGVTVGGRSNRGATGRPRPRNEIKLVDALSTALDDKTMSVTEVAEAVQKAGYRTSSPSFRTIVNQALIASGKFKRVGRGQYTAK